MMGVPNSILMILVYALVGLLVWELRDMKERLGLTLPRQEIKEFVVDKLTPLEVKIENMDLRLSRIETKIDSLLVLNNDKKN